jgi:hypothetical protein
MSFIIENINFLRLQAILDTCHLKAVRTAIVHFLTCFATFSDGIIPKFISSLLDTVSHGSQVSADRKTVFLWLIVQFPAVLDHYIDTTREFSSYVTDTQRLILILSIICQKYGSLGNGDMQFMCQHVNSGDPVVQASAVHCFSSLAKSGCEHAGRLWDHGILQQILVPSTCLGKKEYVRMFAGLMRNCPHSVTVPEEFFDLFEEMLETGDEELSLLVTEALSVVADCPKAYELLERFTNPSS